MKANSIARALFLCSLAAFNSCASNRDYNEAEVNAFGINFAGVPKRVISVQNRAANAYFKNNGTTKRPLVLFLHGFGNEPEPLARIFGMPHQLNKHNFVLLIPRGTLGALQDSTEKKLYWNATKDCCGLEKPNDDAYLTELVQRAIAEPELNIDPTQVYIFGYSNGAFMAHTLACNHADLFRGIIAYAGSSHEDPELCKPTRRVNVLHIHGTKDQIIRFNNPSKRPETPDNFWFPPPADIVERWAGHNGCTSDKTIERIGIIDLNIQPNPNLNKEAGIVFTGKGLFNSDKETEVETYANCSKSRVAFWKVEGGTHFNFFNPGTFDRAWNFIQSSANPQ